MVVGEGEDAGSGVLGAGVEVVHAAGAAEGHLAFGVEPVIAQAVMPGGMAVGGWRSFGGGAVGLARCAAGEGSVGAPFVVVLAELIELGLQLGDGPRGGSGRQPALQRLVKALGLALGLGVPG